MNQRPRMPTEVKDLLLIKLVNKYVLHKIPSSRRQLWISATEHKVLWSVSNILRYEGSSIPLKSFPTNDRQES